MSEGLFPVGDDLALDEPAGRLPPLGGEASFLVTFPGSFVLDVAAVSYTHLDVYKRQLQHIAGDLGRCARRRLALVGASKEALELLGTIRGGVQDVS